MADNFKLTNAEQQITDFRTQLTAQNGAKTVKNKFGGRSGITDGIDHHFEGPALISSVDVAKLTLVCVFQSGAISHTSEMVCADDGANARQFAFKMQGIGVLDFGVVDASQEPTTATDKAATNPVDDNQLRIGIASFDKGGAGLLDHVIKIFQAPLFGKMIDEPLTGPTADFAKFSDTLLNPIKYMSNVGNALIMPANSTLGPVYLFEGLAADLNDAKFIQSQLQQSSKAPALFFDLFDG